MRNGCSITTTLLAKDTSHKTVFPVFTRRRRLRHAGDGGRRRFPDDRRPDDVSRAAVGAADRLGAVRHLFRQRPAGAVLDAPSLSPRAATSSPMPASITSPASKSSSTSSSSTIRGSIPPTPPGRGEAPEVSLLSPGYPYLTETRFDQIEPILETVRRDVVALGLPLRSVEIELGPSQCEFTFHPQVGLAPADTMMLFRSAVKQICRRQGYHASFMCRPKVPNVMSSGWHLHQSLRDRRTGANAFVAHDDGRCRRSAAHFLGGSARACARRGGFHHADDQRLQALSRLCAGARPGDLGRATTAA